jgi:aspartyl-tRNA(Asn)/glutamyl-tRNA(Gln) amidotransferase subunit B
VEVKNMNSFRAVHDALVFEEKRQAAALDAGERITQETRGWLDEKQVTVSQRSKEEANDYRYFPEPDLPPLKLSREFVGRVREQLPELPEVRRLRFVGLGLTQHEAATLTETRERADYFEAVMSAVRAEVDDLRAAKLAANWVLGEVARWQNATAKALDELRVTPDGLAELIGLVERGKVTAAVAKEVFEQMAATGQSAAAIVEEGGLAQIGGEDELAGIARKVIAANDKAVADYRAGKEAALQALVGQMMRETRGRANPQMARELLARELQ